MAGRHNLDLQDMRRILDAKYWNEEGEPLPHVGFTKSLGYMGKYEWAADQYEERPEAPTEAILWLQSRTLTKSFRLAWVAAHEEAIIKTSSTSQRSETASDHEFVRAIRCGVNEAFCDGINSGFYVNSYTTKPGPGLAGMLEELQKGQIVVGLCRESKHDSNHIWNVLIPMFPRVCALSRRSNKKE